MALVTDLATFTLGAITAFSLIMALARQPVRYGSACTLDLTSLVRRSRQCRR